MERVCYKETEKGSRGHRNINPPGLRIEDSKSFAVAEDFDSGHCEH
jgi:hypothetical protein